MNVATDEEENAIELKFGTMDFADMICLTNDELYTLLSGNKNDLTRSEMFEQTWEYLERVATSRSTNRIPIEEMGDRIREMKLQLKAGDKYVKLHEYEVSCLANIVDDKTTVEEIINLVPSLDRFSMDQVENALKIVVEGKQRIAGTMMVM